VYENKGKTRKSTTPNPSLSKEGNDGGLPSSDEEGFGVVRLRGLEVDRVCEIESDGTKPECV
jgi:hypothetical protein